MKIRFVNISTRFLIVAILFTNTTPYSMISRLNKYLTSVYLVISWYIQFLTK